MSLEGRVSLGANLGCSCGVSKAGENRHSTPKSGGSGGNSVLRLDSIDSVLPIACEHSQLCYQMSIAELLGQMERCGQQVIRHLETLRLEGVTMQLEKMLIQRCCSGGDTQTGPRRGAAEPGETGNGERFVDCGLPSTHLTRPGQHVEGASSAETARPGHGDEDRPDYRSCTRWSSERMARRPASQRFLPGPFV
jgi:hypothetical protein